MSDETALHGAIGLGHVGIQFIGDAKFSALYARLQSFLSNGRWPMAVPPGKTKRDELTPEELEEAQLRCACQRCQG